MLNLLQKIRLIRAQMLWRKARRLGRTLRLRIGNVSEFLEQLNAMGIRYVVLRWFEEVPLDQASEAVFSQDIDFLMEHSRLDEVVRLAAKHPGGIKCDIYSPTGKRATGYKKMPYYPPVLGNEVLEHRVFYQDTFYVPEPDYFFKSLAYHLTYHKGTTSGIPSGTTAFPDCPPAKRLYGALLEELGAAVGVSALEKPYTLLRLHRYLQTVEWSMPYDLMVRWPKEKEWMAFLAQEEVAKYQSHADRLPNLIVFLVRADGTASDDVRDATVQLISEDFKILRSVELDACMTRRVSRSVRGGNWMEHGGNAFIPPTLALICNDESPIPFSQDDPRRRKYPLISNAKVLYKNRIRNEINERFPSGGSKRIVLHASDNSIEAQHHLEAVYGDAYPEVCDALLSEL